MVDVKENENMNEKEMKKTCNNTTTDLGQPHLKKIRISTDVTILRRGFTKTLAQA